MDSESTAQAGVSVVVMVALVGVWWLVAAVFMSIGATLAAIPGRTYSKALLVTLAMVLLCVGLSLVLPGMGLPPVLGRIIGLLATVLVVKVIYRCGFVRALVAWTVSVVVSVAVLLGLSALFDAIDPTIGY